MTNLSRCDDINCALNRTRYRNNSNCIDSNTYEINNARKLTLWKRFKLSILDYLNLTDSDLRTSTKSTNQLLDSSNGNLTKTENCVNYSCFDLLQNRNSLNILERDSTLNCVKNSRSSFVSLKYESNYI